MESARTVGTFIAPQKASHLQTPMSAATQSSVIPPIPPLKRSYHGEFVSHALTTQAVTHFLGVNPTSELSNLKVCQLRRQYGPNNIQSIRPLPAWRLLVDQCASIVIALFGDNLLRPRLIKNQTKLHELFVFFSVLGGISLFGLVGIVMGPVVLAITLGLLSTFKAVVREELKSEGKRQGPLKSDLSAKQNSTRFEVGI
jgi:magnesium-transporting ATPase (P-type)